MQTLSLSITPAQTAAWRKQIFQQLTERTKRELENFRHYEQAVEQVGHPRALFSSRHSLSACCMPAMGCGGRNGGVYPAPCRFKDEESVYPPAVPNRVQAPLCSRHRGPGCISAGGTGWASGDRQAGVGPSFATGSLCDAGPGIEPPTPGPQFPHPEQGSWYPPHRLGMMEFTGLGPGRMSGGITFVLGVKRGSWKCWAGPPSEAAERWGGQGGPGTELSVGAPGTCL